MRFAVVGAGALGSVFAARLAGAGHDVLLVGRSPAHVEAIRSDGLLLPDSSGRTELVGSFQAQTYLAGCRPVDVILFLTKSQDCGTAAKQAIGLMGPSTIPIALANGIGHMETLAAFYGSRPLVAGVTMVGARVVRPGHVEITDATAAKAAGNWIGPWAKSCSPAQLEGVAHALSASGIPTEVVADIAPIIWTKLAMACAMNAVASVTGHHVRALLASPSACSLLAQVIDEVVSVGREKGIALDPVAVRHAAFEAYRNAPGHLPSMAADMLAGRRTEVEALNAAVVREAVSVGVAAPANAILARLISAIEDGRKLPPDGGER